MKEKKGKKRKIEEDDTFDLCSLSGKGTGLPIIIWAITKGKGKYPPNIKVQRNYSPKILYADWFSVTISNSPEIRVGDQGEISKDDLDKIFQWIIINKELLLQYWEYEMDTMAFIELIKKI